MALLAVFALATFHAAYRPSPMPAQIESERDLTYDHIVQLVGVSNDTINAHPGGSAEFTLYWRSLKSTSRVVIIDIHTYGEGLIALTTYPGTGNWPATVWQPDQYWAEHYSIKIPGTTEPGHSVPILVFLLYSDDSSLLPILGPGNAPLMFPAVMQLRIEP